MLGKSKYIKVIKQGYLLPEAIRIFILFLFFFACGQPSASAATHGDESVNHKDLTCHLSEDLSNRSFHVFQRPFESLPIPNEQESSNENELSDNFDDDKNPLTWKNLFNDTSNSSCSVRSHLFHQIQSLQNRSTVPLFILYLSWKSFLL